MIARMGICRRNQEDEMLKDMLGGHKLVAYKWVLLTKALFSVLIMTAGLALIYVLTLPGRPTTADAMAVVRCHGTGHEEEPARAAVLKWMRENSEMPEQILSDIYDAASDRGNADLILAICVVESNFNPMAKSDKGAMGLMGIMPTMWLEELKAQGIVKERRDLYTVPSNIASGAYVLGRYLAGTDSIEEALTRYVGGDSSYARKILEKLGKIYLVRRLELKDKTA
jgi:hypothetical protein